MFTPKPVSQPAINSKSCCSWWWCYHHWLGISRLTWAAGGLHWVGGGGEENSIWVTRTCGWVAPPSQAGNHADSVNAISPEQYQGFFVTRPLASRLRRELRVSQDTRGKKEDVPFLGHLFTGLWQRALATLWKSSPA